MSQDMPFIAVSTGTLVPCVPVLEKIPNIIKWPLTLPHQMGLAPHPDRFIADAAYGRLKEMGNCWVEPLVGLGLADRARSLAAYKAMLWELIREEESQGRRPRLILVGQSQGGLVAIEAALDTALSPYIIAVVTAGAPFLGSPATQSKLLGWSSRVFPGVAQMVPGDESLTLLADRVVTEWPPHILPILIADGGDELVSVRSAWGLRFPAGVIPDCYLLGETAPEDLEEDITYLIARARKGQRHISMCRHLSTIEILEDLRRRFTRDAPVPLAA